MNTLNHIQLKEVVRDYLLSQDTNQPLIIWGNLGMGKIKIISSVVKDMQFYQLVKGVDKPDWWKKGGSGNPIVETACHSFNEVWEIRTIKDTAKVIVDAIGTDFTNIKTINSQLNATSYIYEMPVEDWVEWGKTTKAIQPHILQFVEQNSQLYLNTDEVNSDDWVRISNRFEVKWEESSLRPDMMCQILYECVSVELPSVAKDFKSWLQNCYGVNLI